jgi:hypothetical protein
VRPSRSRLAELNLPLVGQAGLLDECGEVMLGGFSQPRVAVRVAPADRCDADAQHLLGEREHL